MDRGERDGSKGINTCQLCSNSKLNLRERHIQNNWGTGGSMRFLKDRFPTKTKDWRRVGANYPYSQPVAELQRMQINMAVSKAH